MTVWLAILAVGLVAGTLGGIVGFGASVLMVPILSIAFGPKAAIPIMAIASVMANASRVLVWWREVDWRTALAFATVAAPVGFLTGIVASTGPISTPLFLAVGLVKGAFVGTEAAASVAMYGAKLAVFGANAVYTPDEIVRGLLVGAGALMLARGLGGG